jgi:hypothetical protein
MEYIIDSWEKAKAITLIRSSPCGIYPQSKIDKGVNFFILALEKLGCKTHYSCEGHFSKDKYIPELYVVFEASRSIILCIKQMLFNIFRLEKESEKNQWSLRISLNNNQDKQEKLIFLADQWVKILGPLKYSKGKNYVQTL